MHLLIHSFSSRMRLQVCVGACPWPPQPANREGLKMAKHKLEECGYPDPSHKAYHVFIESFVLFSHVAAGLCGRLPMAPTTHK